MDPVGPVPAFIDGWLLADLPPAAIETLVAAAGAGSRSPLLSVELRHLGARLADTGPDHGALASLDAGFAVAVYSVVPDTDRALAAGRTPPRCGRRWPRGRPSTTTPTSPSVPSTWPTSSHPRNASGSAASRRSTTPRTASWPPIRSQGANPSRPRGEADADAGRGVGPAGRRAPDLTGKPILAYRSGSWPTCSRRLRTRPDASSSMSWPSGTARRCSSSAAV